MYIGAKNLYLNEKRNILFDLNHYEIFYVTAPVCDYLSGYVRNLNGLNEEERQLLQKIENCKMTEEKQENPVRGLKIHITNTCNLNCKYCYAHGGNYGKEDSFMSMQTTELVVERLNKDKMLQNIEYVTFFGGEPFLNLYSIEYICKHLRNKNIKFLTQSNGTIINDKILELLKRFEIGVTISLDGPREVNDFNRVDAARNGTYEIIIKNIRKMQENGVRVEAIEATLSNEFKDNYSKEDIADFIYENTGVRFIKVEYDMRMEEYGINEKEMEEEIAFFFRRCMEGKFLMAGTTQRVLSTMLSRRYRDAICPAGYEVLSVDVNGAIFPCQLFLECPKCQLGSIESGLIHKIPQKFLKSKNEKCQKCEAKSTCCMCLFHKEYDRMCLMNVKMQEKTLDKLADMIIAGEFSDFYNQYKFFVERR